MKFRLKYDNGVTKVGVASSDPILVSAVYDALRKSVGQHSRIELREEGGILGDGPMSYDSLCGSVRCRKPYEGNAKESRARPQREGLTG
ncbi:MAG: hypothetical protein WC613_04900 [Candidatus Aenigmatarchaeota archaeon]